MDQHKIITNCKLQR